MEVAMLQQVAEGVWVHQSEFLQSNAIVVKGSSGVLLIDPGITSEELTVLAADIETLGLPVVVGFSTHPHWDHLLWSEAFGSVPRYGTARGLKEVEDFLSNPDWRTQIRPLLPDDYADHIPINDLFGKITALPAGATELPWDGPKVRIIEHAGHAAGSAAVLIQEAGVLVAGDMVSDILTPFLELDSANPIDDYLTALKLFESVNDQVEVVVPGHGSVGDGDAFRMRTAQDRAYVEALRDGNTIDDWRLTDGPQKELLANVHAWQAQHIAENASN